MVFEVKGREALSAVINVRLTPGEKVLLREDADLARISMSELIRRRYFGRPIIANADAAMIRELRRMGGLMKHIHHESSGAYSVQTGAAINSIVQAIDKLSVR